MLVNYILWLIVGLFVGLLGHIFDVNKMKGLGIYLLVGMFVGYVGCFFVHFFIWPVPNDEINIAAIILGGIIAYVGIRYIDYFFHL